MAPRSFWKGYLKLSLVTCPIALTPATSEAQKLRFAILNRATGNRVASAYVDSETGAAVGEEDEVKGFQQGEAEHVLLEDEELDSVGLESTRTIDIDTFVPAESIAWIWYDTPHYVTPEGKVGAEAYAVIRDAMAKTGTVAISRVVMYRRERAVMLEPRDNGIVLWTLRYGDEVRDAAPYFAQIDSETPDAKLMTLVKKLIDERTRPWDPALVDDPVQDRMKEIIAAKQKKKRPVRSAKAKPEPDAAPAGNVVSIMDALRRSLAADSKRK